jgi:hypothetical protein
MTVLTTTVNDRVVDVDYFYDKDSAGQSILVVLGVEGIDVGEFFSALGSSPDLKNELHEHYVLASCAERARIASVERENKDAALMAQAAQPTKKGKKCSRDDRTKMR